MDIQGMQSYTSEPTQVRHTLHFFNTDISVPSVTTHHIYKQGCLAADSQVFNIFFCSCTVCNKQLDDVKWWLQHICPVLLKLTVSSAKFLFRILIRTLVGPDLHPSILWHINVTGGGFYCSVQWMGVFFGLFYCCLVGFFGPIKRRSSLKCLESTFQTFTLFYPLLTSKVTQEICIHTEAWCQLTTLPLQ